MTTRISIDGQVGDEGSAKISVLDRGFLYGDSVYEVLRTYGGRPFALPEHLERLRHSAELLELPMPLDDAGLRQEIAATIAATGNAESYVRVIVTRGAGPIGLDPALAAGPCRVIIVTALKRWPDELYAQGAPIALVPTGRPAEGPAGGAAKSGNYLTNLLALGRARRSGAHEALLLDAEGHVAEGSSSNVFVVREEGLLTPPVEAGILEGITRRKVIALARRAGIAVHEQPLTPEDLFGASEVFITSTLREVMPVTRVDDRAVGGGVPGRLTTRLRELFTAYVAAWLARAD
ncbi:MAG: aminotransferase class IV [Deltaproteobacteria bacterium]|nr:aminotransferase class IV [Deltaproteobacteria bacterium]